MRLSAFQAYTRPVVFHLPGGRYILPLLREGRGHSDQPSDPMTLGG
jgi:hypothetical protein